MGLRLNNMLFRILKQKTQKDIWDAYKNVTYQLTFKGN